MTIVLPGYVPDVHTADALDPAWGNAIRDRAPQVFTTQATLTAAVVAPQVGQSAVITTGTGAFTGMAAPGEYIYAGATDGWRPPWNNGWGEVGRSVDVTSANQANSTENVIAVGTTFTAVANRLYRIRIIVGAIRNNATANATITFKLKDGVTLIEQLRNMAIIGTTAGGTFDAMTMFEVETSLTAGAHTINLTIQSSNAAGYLVNAPSSPTVMVIDDIGPSGAPS